MMSVLGQFTPLGLRGRTTGMRQQPTFARQVRLPPLCGGLELDEGGGRAVIPPDAGN
jgi:hypothetical protein